MVTGEGGGGGGKHFSKTFFYFLYVELQKQSFQPIFFNWYLSNEKTAFVDKSRVEPTIFFIEKISFSLKKISGHFYGQSFIKTVRGPCVICVNTAKTTNIPSSKGKLRSKWTDGSYIDLGNFAILIMS